MVSLKTSGWVIDLKMDNNQAILIFKTLGGKTIQVKDKYNPHFYLILEKNSNPEEIQYLASQHPNIDEISVQRKIADMLSMKRERVLRVSVDGITSFRKTIRDMARIPGIKEIAESSVPHYFNYICSKGITFFEAYSIEHSQTIKSIRRIKTSRLPELNLSAIHPSGERVSDNPKTKPDVIFTYNGDTFLEKFPGIKKTKFGCFIDGVIHIDIRKDIRGDIYSEGYEPSEEDISEGILNLGRERFSRVMELSRISGVKPDLIPRITPGRLNTYLHIREAMKEGVLVPDMKKFMERPKSMRLLSVIDKGGLIFYPTPGIYRNLAKCDFSSMYPNIIVRYNISPETMNCKCCSEGIPVPEAGWHFCKKRRGVIPRGIRGVLERRLHLKKMMKSETERSRKRSYDIRQRALKNILVTCFGYLGFKNFVFSNVECKECVMLYGRHILMRTKEIAESLNLEVIYGIVDSIFVTGGSPSKYRKFVEKVSNEIGIELELDCIFDAIAFPSSKDSSGVASHYYGITREGEIEARGIGLRHSDAPPIIKSFQSKAIHFILGKDLRSGILKAEQLYYAYDVLLTNQEVPIEDLVITKRMRKPLEEYLVNAPHVAASRMLEKPGKYISFLYSLSGPVPIEKFKNYRPDIRKYKQLLKDSLDELVRGLEKERSVEIWNSLLKNR